MSDVRTPLLNVVLTGNFRPNVHGRWLMVERLPEQLPVASEDEQVVRAWARLVHAQTRYLALGAPLPHEFKVLAAEFAGALQRERGLSPAMRYDVLQALALGPSEDGGPMSGLMLDDKILRRHWDGWAKDAQQWTKTDFAYWRFIRGFGLERAIERADRERDAAEARWHAEQEQARLKDEAWYDAWLAERAEMGDETARAILARRTAEAALATDR